MQKSAPSDREFVAPVTNDIAASLAPMSRRAARLDRVSAFLPHQHRRATGTTTEDWDRGLGIGERWNRYGDVEGQILTPRSAC